MPDYSRQPDYFLNYEELKIASFMGQESKNLDGDTVEAFGDEWEKFSVFEEEEIALVGDQYFDIVDSAALNKESVVLDMGCGSGRWSRYVSDKVKQVEAVDPSKAITLSARNHQDKKNIRWTQASVSTLPFSTNSFDFVVCLGVLHHMPDTGAALRDVVRYIKPGGSILLYLYYALDNRGPLYKALFKASHLIRLVISKLPNRLKMLVCDVIAILVYWPLTTMARIVKSIFSGSTFYHKMPLSYYCDKSFFVMRNDSLDRFGTPLESRFTKEEIRSMMQNAGLDNIVFSPNEPYWHATGQKKGEAQSTNS